MVLLRPEPKKGDAGRPSHESSQQLVGLDYVSCSEDSRVAVRPRFEAIDFLHVCSSLD